LILLCLVFFLQYQANAWLGRTSPKWPVGNESVLIQLAQCRFPRLAISTAEILIYFSSKIYGSNFIKQHSETVIYLFICYARRQHNITSPLQTQKKLKTNIHKIRHNGYGLKLPKCWLQFKKKNIVSFVIIFGILSFPSFCLVGC